MDFSVGLGRNERIDEIAGLSRAAEDAGFSHISFIDSQNLSRDVYAMMSIAVVNTHRIKIGHGVTNPFTRHPAVTANATATLDELSGGRAFLGIGVGSSSVRTMNMGPRSQMEFRQCVEFIRKYMSGEEAEWQNATMHSEWIRRPVPIYMGATGPKACELAGEIADGIMHSGIHPEMYKWQMEQIERGAEKAGRSLEAIDTWVRCMMFISSTKEAARREGASQAATAAVAKYRMLLQNSPHTSELRRRLEKVEPGLLDDFRRIHDVWEAYQHERIDAPHAAAVTQRVIDCFMFTGTPDDICEHVLKLKKLGLKNVSLTVYTNIDKKGVILEVGSKIIRNLRN